MADLPSVAELPFRDAASRVATDHDVFMCYQILLGRDPEGPWVIDEAKTQPVRSVMGAFVQSPEFVDHVKEPFYRGARLRHEVESLEPSAEQKGWLIEVLQFSDDAKSSIQAASSWNALFSTLFTISGFSAGRPYALPAAQVEDQSTVVSPSPVQRPEPPPVQRSHDQSNPATNSVSASRAVTGRGECSLGDSLTHTEIAEVLQDTLIFDLQFYRKKHGIEGDAASVIASFLRDPLKQASPYFDPVWYASKNLAAGASGVEVIRHYLMTGRSNGCWPSPIFNGSTIDIPQEQVIRIIAESDLFDAALYNLRNADVARSGSDPLRHYCRVGHSEHKRAANTYFDNHWYVSHYPEVKKYRWHPAIHYILAGSIKGASTSPFVDVAWLEKVATGYGWTGEETLLGWLMREGRSRTFGPNEYFDPVFYAALEPAASAYPGGPFAHFLDVGWKTPTDPSTRFSVSGYASANPDVAERGTNPFLHYVLTGRVEGRNPKPRVTSIPANLERFSEPEYGATGPVMALDSDPQMPPRFSLSIAVHLHLYYTEMAQEFCERLQNIPVPFHLFVSVPQGRGDPAPIKAVFENRLENCVGVTVVTPENRGRDVAPFLVEIGKELLKYDLVLHLHSKRSPHSPKHADWRRYLLHYTLGNKAIVTQILTAFYADPTIGIFQPPYHPQTRAQPKWGENRARVSELLPRLGLSYVGDSCPDFPAGSFFWARTDALRPMLDGRIALNDFDEENGQVDSTLAHALERLFGLVPVLRGYSVVCRFIDVAHNLVNYYGKSRSFGLFEHDRTADIMRYQAAVRQRKKGRGRIAVVTAISGPFDALLLPDYIEADIDYLCVSDTITDGYGVFRICPPPYLDADPRRTARYVKTNLLRLFPGYEFVVWIDANVLARGPITRFVAETEAAGCCVGAIPHPIRPSYTEEAAIAVDMKLDDVELIRAQLATYLDVEGLANADLIETNFMVFDARKPQTSSFAQLWWNQINTYSRRDQLSINYCLIKAGANWHPLLSEYMSTRDSPSFSLFRHGLNQWGPKPHIYSSWHVPHANDGHLLPLPETHSWVRHLDRLDLDVVVCVHNALDDVRLCLESVELAFAGRGKLVLVDDASEAPTAEYLRTYAAEKGAHLTRLDERLGYTKAANMGVRAGSHRNVLLLNSDTIVPPGALDKLSDALDRDALLGIVGPLSNAASFQSVPSTTGTASQTAINQLPPGMSTADMDLFLERRWDGTVPRTPLVHGFCFCVRRAVFDQIGLFDEENFPKGYGEENDFCFRAADAGFDLGVLTSTYVFHAKSKSYAESERTGLMDEGMAALIRKVTKPRIARAVETMRVQPAFAAAQQAVAPLFTRVESVPNQQRGRLFLLPSLRSDGLPAGSGYVRVLLPYRCEAVCREWEVSQLRTPELPPLTPADTVLVQREAGVLESGSIAEWIAGVRQAGARLVYEIDDDLLDGAALKGRGFRGDTEDLAERVLAFSRAADCVTVSSDALFTKFAALNPAVTLIPNALDPDLWQLTSELPPHLQESEGKDDRDRIVIGYVGTPTHGEDLAVVRDVIAKLHKRFPDRLDVQIIGGFGSGEKTFGSVIPLPRANDYPSFVRWLRKNARWDIGVIPLADNGFNTYKSYLKFVELAALGTAIVCSNGPEYSKVVRDGDNGMIVPNTKDAWIRALVDLVSHRDKRKRLAASAYYDVYGGHTFPQLAPQLLSVLHPLT